MLKIRKQVLAKPKMHICLFSCWVFAIAGWFVPEFHGEPFVAAGFVIIALIDFNTYNVDKTILSFDVMPTRGELFGKKSAHNPPK